MIYYISIILICSLVYCFTIKNDKAIGYILLSILAIFLSCGYMCGTDWHVYEKMFESASISGFNQFRKEKGFLIYMLIFKSLGVDFWFFVIINKLLVFIILLSFINEFDVKKSGFLLFFLVEVGFMLFIDNPLRNFIAFGIALLAIKQLLHKKNFSFFLYSTLAVTFHFSALILFILYFFRKLHLSTNLILIIYLSIFFVCLNINFGFLEYIIPSDIYSTRVKDYLINSQFVRTSFFSGFIYRTATLLLILFYREQIVKLRYGDIAFNLSIIFFFIYPLSMAFVIIQRLLYYIFPLTIIVLLYAIKSVSKLVLKETFAILFIIFCFIKLNSTLTQDCRYIPYSNYFYYTVTNERRPSYKERVLYNERNSKYPRAKGSWE